MAEDFKQRLRRLRRAPAPPPLASDPVDPAQAEDPGLPIWMRARLRGQRARAELQATPGQARSLDPPQDLTQHENSRGVFAARTSLLEPMRLHGCFALQEVDQADRGVFEFMTGDDALAQLEPRSAVYLDIETTGLSGGAGTTPFMIGLGRFDEESGQFELWQGFLREPDEEPALLAECARRVAASSGVVSFFGKSFDRHRLEDKMRMHGVEPPFATRPHLDLYHPLRRLYRGALDDGRLQTMEHHLCGVRRADDLPGSFAPAAWFDFLSERPHLLEDVFRHNFDDILSLVTLYAHLGRALVEERAGGGSLEAESSAPLAFERAWALAQLYLKRRLFDPCLTWAERALARTADGPRARAVTLLRGECLRRAGRSAEALEAYRSLMAERDACAAAALFEAAKLEPTDGAALPLLERALDLARISDLRLAAHIEKRRDRIALRCARRSAGPQ